VIGYIGSFVDYEGLDDLTRACGQLKKQGLQFRLLLVGASEGPIYKRIQSIAAQQGLGDWLILPGRVPHHEVESWYSLIDIAPFPRKPLPVTELVTPLKPLEAMAMKKVVVMSSVAAMAEMVEEGVTGLVFQKGNQDSLVSTLSHLITEPELRIRLGEQARHFVESERNWMKMGEKIRSHKFFLINSEVNSETYI
jgi:glycosyltransferase involved in cell wall biosynthesis